MRQTSDNLGIPKSESVKGAVGITRCDLFARIEHLHGDLAPFEAHLGFELTPIERVNTSPHRPDYQSYFIPEDVEIVARICARDIERFGYRF